MRTAQLIVDSSSHPDEAYRAIAQFEEYPQMERVLRGLQRFPGIDHNLIPKNSLLREFIG